MSRKIFYTGLILLMASTLTACKAGRQQSSEITDTLIPDTSEAGSYESVEGAQIKMITDNTEVVITLNGSRAAADLVEMLPLELTLIERNSFAKGMLWIAHHILNRSWYSHLFKGKYTPVRTFQTVINFAVLFFMLGLMVSGIILSREVFAFLTISGGIALARLLHVLSAFWGFVLMALHLGLHWNMILGMVRKAAGPVFSQPLRILLCIVAATVAGYGFYAFLKNQFLSYMFLTSSFVFFDFERPVLLFFTEYIAIMSLFIFLAHYASKWIQKMAGRRKKLVEKKKFLL